VEKLNSISQAKAARSDLATDHARLCRPLAMTPGLFQPLFDTTKKVRPKLFVEIAEKTGTIILEGPHALDAYDARTLTTLVALSATNGITLSPKPETLIGNVTRTLLDPKNVCEADTIFVMTSPTSLLREMGTTRGKNTLNALTDSLRRLAGVTLYAAMGEQCEALHLMGFYKNEEPGRDRMCVALNPIIAGAITGGQYARLDMNEQRAIKGEPAFLLYMRLCAVIDWPTGRKTKTRDGLSNTTRFKLDTLVSYIWPDETDNQSTARTRRQKLREALNELAALPHWTVHEYVKDAFNITRLHTPKDKAANHSE
jgi:hypothetical protein